MKTLIVLSVLALAVHAEIDCTNLSDGIYGWGCRSYTQCNGGVGAQVDCPAPLVFNYLTNGCDEMRNTPPPCGVYRDCSQKADGRYADTLLKCTSFYTCINGAFYGHNPCIPGTVFNEKSQICDWPESVEPPCGTLEVEGTTEMPETTAAPSAAPTVSPDNGNCENREDGRYADETLGCKAFYTCLGRINIGLQPCVPGTVFNEEIQVCDWPRNVRAPCGTLVEETTTEEAQTTTVVANTTEDNFATTESSSTEDYDSTTVENDSSEEAPVPVLYERIIQAATTRRRPRTTPPRTPTRPRYTTRPRPSSTRRPFTRRPL